MPGPLLSFPRFKAIDGNGVPLRGGKLYTYTAGTSTAKDAYTDRDLSVAHTNPIVLDSDGEATIYLKGTYKMNLLTSADAQVPGYPVDDVGVQTTEVRLSEYASLAAAVTAIGATETDLWIDTDDTMAANVTVPATLTLRFIYGSVITHSGYTLTINGAVEAGPWQIFAGNGTVSFGTGRDISVNWFYDGSDGDGAFQDAVTSLAGVGGTIKVEGETYNFNASVELDNTQHTDDSGTSEAPLVKILGQGRASVIKATAGSISCFLETGGSGVIQPNIFFEDLYLDGNGQTTVHGINLSSPGKQSGMRRVWITDFDTVGCKLEYDAEGTDCSSFTVDECHLWSNGVNFYAEDLDTTAYNLYGLTFRNTTFSTATGATTAGIGCHLKHVRYVVFINCVAQSNGYSGATAGYGYGIKLDECQWVHSSGKLHLENHDEDASAYDLVITGSATYPSEYIFLRGTTKKANLTFCNNVEIDSNNLGTITDDETALYTLLNRDNDDDANQGPRIDVTHNKWEHLRYDNGDQGRIQNYITRRINDESHIASPWMMTGNLGNYIKYSNDLSVGTWADTSCTVALAQRVGPHGLTDNTVADLTATAAGGRIQQAADATWDDSFKTFVIWMKKISGSGVVNLRLRNSAGDVEPGLCTLTENWLPYAVCGTDDSTNAITVRIELQSDTDNIAVWGPVLREGIYPGPGLINDTASAVAEADGIGFPGGAYFGWNKVGRVFTATHNWNPGSVADGGHVTDTDTVTGAALGDFVAVAPAVDIGDLTITGHVSAANTVKLYLYNLSGGAIDPNGGAAFDVYIRVWERP